jgi:hypothetical protein
MSIIDLQLISTGSLGNAEPIGMSVDGHYVLIADAQRAGNSALSRRALVDAQTGAYQTIIASADPDNAVQVESTAVSGDGRYVAYIGFDSTGTRLQLWDRTTGSTRTLVSGVEGDVAMSPDGRFLAYTTRETGRRAEDLVRPATSS